MVDGEQLLFVGGSAEVHKVLRGLAQTDGGDVTELPEGGVTKALQVNINRWALEVVVVHETAEKLTIK